MAVDIVIPQAGESVTSGVLSRWLKGSYAIPGRPAGEEDVPPRPSQIPRLARRPEGDRLERTVELLHHQLLIVLQLVRISEDGVELQHQLALHVGQRNDVLRQVPLERHGLRAKVELQRAL